MSVDDEVKLVSLTFLKLFTEVVEMVIDRKVTALESVGQRSKSSTPVAPSSLEYFCINSMAITPSALTSAGFATGDELISRQHSWLAGPCISRDRECQSLTYRS